MMAAPLCRRRSRTLDLVPVGGAPCVYVYMCVLAWVMFFVRLFSVVVLFLDCILVCSYVFVWINGDECTLLLLTLCALNYNTANTHQHNHIHIHPFIFIPKNTHCHCISDIARKPTTLLKEPLLSIRSLCCCTLVSSLCSWS